MTGYSVHYKGEFKSLKGTHYTVEILSKQPGLVFPTPITFDGSEPCIIERKSVEIFDSIASMAATINISSDRNYQFVHVLTAPDRFYALRIKQGDKLLFLGWLENELYEEQYDLPPYWVSIVANDALAALEHYELDIDALPRCPGKLAHLCRLSDLIESCLAATGLGLEVEYRIDLKATINQHDTGRAIFDFLAIDAESYFVEEDGKRKGAKVKEVLEGVLSSFSARVYQHNGKWIVERVSDMVARQPAAITMLDTAAIPFVELPSFSVTSAYGKQSVSLNVDRWDSLLHRPPVPPIEVVNLGAGVVDNSRAVQHWAETWQDSPEGNVMQAVGKEQSLRIEYPTESRKARRFYCSVPISLRKGDTVNITIPLRLEHRNEYFVPEAKKVHYFPLEVLLLDSSDKVIAQANVIDIPPPPNHPFQLIFLEDVNATVWLRPPNPSDPLDVRNKMQLWGYQYPIVGHKECFSRRGATASLSVSPSKYNESLMLQANRLMILIDTQVMVADEPKGDKQLRQPPVWVYPKAWEIGAPKVSVNDATGDKDNDDPVDSIVGLLNQAYRREAPERELALRMDRGIRIDAEYKGALFYSKSGALCTLIAPDANTATGIDEMMLRDNFAQYARKRDKLSGKIARNEMPTPAEVYGISSRGDNRYVLTSLVSDLYNDEHEISIEQMHRDQYITATTWQS